MFLNYLLSYTEETKAYWNEAYLPSVFSKFSALESLPAYACNPWELLNAIQYHCGLKLQLEGTEHLFEDCMPFERKHVLGMPCRMKLLMPTAQSACGEVLWVEGQGMMMNDE